MVGSLFNSELDLPYTTPEWCPLLNEIDFNPEQPKKTLNHVDEYVEALHKVILDVVDEITGGDVVSYVEFAEYVADPSRVKFLCDVQTLDGLYNHYHFFLITVDGREEKDFIIIPRNSDAVEFLSLLYD